MYRVKQEDLESRKLKHSFAKNIKMGFQQGQTMSLVFFAMIACVMFPCGAYSIAMMIEALTDIKHTKEGREPKYPMPMRMAIAFGLSSVFHSSLLLCHVSVFFMKFRVQQRQVLMQCQRMTVAHPCLASCE